MKKLLALMLIPASFAMAMQGPAVTTLYPHNLSNKPEIALIITDTVTNKRRAIVALEKGNISLMGYPLSINDVVTIPEANFRYRPSGNTPAVDLTIYGEGKVEVTPRR